MRHETRDFLGSGWKFPPCLDSRGRIQLSHQEQDVEEAIRIILLTQTGERPMRPDFGSELHTLLFAPNDAGTAGLARRFVEQALNRCEPRIDLLEVRCSPDSTNGARLMIQVRYSLRATSSERNLVFPFYIIPGED